MRNGQIAVYYVFPFLEISERRGGDKIPLTVPSASQGPPVFARAAGKASHEALFLEYAEEWVWQEITFQFLHSANGHAAAKSGKKPKS